MMKAFHPHRYKNGDIIREEIMNSLNLMKLEGYEMKKKLLALFLAVVLVSETIIPSGTLAKEETLEGNITKNSIQSMAIISGKKLKI